MDSVNRQSEYIYFFVERDTTLLTKFLLLFSCLNCLEEEKKKFLFIYFFFIFGSIEYWVCLQLATSHLTFFYNSFFLLLLSLD